MKPSFVPLICLWMGWCSIDASDVLIVTNTHQGIEPWDDLKTDVAVHLDMDASTSSSTIATPDTRTLVTASSVVTSVTADTDHMFDSRYPYVPDISSKLGRPPTKFVSPFKFLLDLSQIPKEDHQWFQDAADRWRQVVTSYFEPITLGRWSRIVRKIQTGCTYPRKQDELHICVRYNYRSDGIGQAIGTAFVLGKRASSNLPTYGILSIDQADLAWMKAENRLGAVILHEIGHLLGLRHGTYTAAKLQGSRPTCPYYGAHANHEFRQVSRCLARPVPMETDGGNGTACSHWDKECLGDELVTGQISVATPTLSRISVGALHDLGYRVSYAGADPYQWRDLNRKCRCKVRPWWSSLPRQRSLQEMEHGEAVPLLRGGGEKGLQGGVSEAAHAVAIKVGRKLLAETAAIEVEPGDMEQNDIVHVGVERVAVFVKDGDRIFAVVVVKGQ